MGMKVEIVDRVRALEDKGHGKFSEGEIKYYEEHEGELKKLEADWKKVRMCRCPQCGKYRAPAPGWQCKVCERGDEREGKLSDKRLEPHVKAEERKELIIDRLEKLRPGYPFRMRCPESSLQRNRDEPLRFSYDLRDGGEAELRGNKEWKRQNALYPYLNWVRVGVRSIEKGTKKGPRSAFHHFVTTRFALEVWDMRIVLETVKGSTLRDIFRPLLSSGESRGEWPQWVCEDCLLNPDYPTFTDMERFTHHLVTEHDGFSMKKAICEYDKIVHEFVLEKRRAVPRHLLAAKKYVDEVGSSSEALSKLVNYKKYERFQTGPIPVPVKIIAEYVRREKQGEFNPGLVLRCRHCKALHFATLDFDKAREHMKIEHGKSEEAVKSSFSRYFEGALASVLEKYLAPGARAQNPAAEDAGFAEWVVGITMRYPGYTWVEENTHREAENKREAAWEVRKGIPILGPLRRELLEREQALRPIEVLDSKPVISSLPPEPAPPEPAPVTPTPTPSSPAMILDPLCVMVLDCRKEGLVLWEEKNMLYAGKEYRSVSRRIGVIDDTVRKFLEQLNITPLKGTLSGLPLIAELKQFGAHAQVAELKKMGARWNVRTVSGKKYVRAYVSRGPCGQTRGRQEFINLGPYEKIRQILETNGIVLR